MPASTVTLQSVVNFASTHNDLLPLANVGGFTNEPALSLCNDVMSDIFMDGNDLKFNRKEMPMLISCPNRIDQLFAGACVFTLSSTTTSPQPTWISQGWGIDLASSNAITVSGGVVTLNTLETHRIPVGAVIYIIGVTATTGTASAYNSPFVDNGTSSGWTGGYTLTAVGATSMTFSAITGQNNGDILGAPGITDFSFGQSVSFQEINNTSSPPNINFGTVYRDLPYVSRVANPDKISMLNDLGTGVLRIRWNFVPGSTVWGARIVYQKNPPLKVALTDTWTPIPDSYSAVYRQGLLYRMYRYLNSPMVDNEYKKFLQEYQKMQSGDDAETSEVYCSPDSLMDGQFYYNSP